MTTTGGNYGRKFGISRENGQTPTKGRSYFFEWLQQLPSDQGKRKFETRTGNDGSPKYYELFQAIDGYLIAIDREVKTNFKTQEPEAWLVLHFIDAEEQYRVEVGQIDNRYATDFMKRILDKNFDPNQKVRISPVESQATATSKGGLFLSTYSGPNKLEASFSAPHLAGMPQPYTREWKGKTEYNWLPVAEWLYEQVQTWVVPKLMKDPIAAPPRVPLPSPTGTHTPQAEYKAPAPPVNTAVTANHEPPSDDLPF